MLYLVPTPVGNLEDITLRALRILKTADLILAEDTRTSRKLLDYFGITTPVKAFHAHNEHQSAAYFVQLIQEGKTIPASCSCVPARKRVLASSASPARQHSFPQLLPPDYPVTASILKDSCPIKRGVSRA